MQDSVRTRSLTGMALLVALNCISAYIIIPLPFTESPLALQTLVVNLVGFLLPTKKAGTVMAVYIL
ncbi:MAG: biotin transporter BioY, partial [Megasphaera lornae]